MPLGLERHGRPASGPVMGATARPLAPARTAAPRTGTPAPSPAGRGGRPATRCGGRSAGPPGPAPPGPRGSPLRDPDRPGLLAPSGQRKPAEASRDAVTVGSIAAGRHHQPPLLAGHERLGQGDRDPGGTPSTFHPGGRRWPSSSTRAPRRPGRAGTGGSAPSPAPSGSTTTTASGTTRNRRRWRSHPGRPAAAATGVGLLLDPPHDRPAGPGASSAASRVKPPLSDRRGRPAHPARPRPARPAAGRRSRTGSTPPRGSPDRAASPPACPTGTSMPTRTTCAAPARELDLPAAPFRRPRPGGRGGLRGHRERQAVEPDRHPDRSVGRQRDTLSRPSDRPSPDTAPDGDRLDRVRPGRGGPAGLARPSLAYSSPRRITKSGRARAFQSASRSAGLLEEDVHGRVRTRPRPGRGASREAGRVRRPARRRADRRHQAAASTRRNHGLLLRRKRLNLPGTRSKG